jgi:mannosyltransferase OCH1-like enzyme
MNKIIPNNVHNKNIIKQKRMKYSFTFKKKWVSIYNYYLNKLTSIQLTFFTKLINGRDGNNVIKKGYVNESTFRKWIKL